MTGEYRLAEWCMYGYRENVSKYEQLMRVMEELRGGNDMHGQNYGARYSGGGYSDPVARWYAVIERTEKELARYEGYTLTRIASLTGTSYGMVRVKHKKALNALRLALEG